MVVYCSGMLCTFCVHDFQNVLVDDVRITDNREPWDELTLYWTPPSSYQGHIEFR